jgi:hypothetical protein
VTHNQVLISSLHLIRKHESHFHSILTHSLYMQTKSLSFTHKLQKNSASTLSYLSLSHANFQEQHISREFVSSLTCNHPPISKQTPQSPPCTYSYRARISELLPSPKFHMMLNNNNLNLTIFKPMSKTCNPSIKQFVHCSHSEKSSINTFQTSESNQQLNNISQIQV